MPQIAQIKWIVSGDIGGQGVSRFGIVSESNADISGADVQAAATATHALFDALHAYQPGPITWTCDPLADVYDYTSGLVSGPMPITTLPPPVLGSGGGNWAAGVGARINWKTETVHGRRLMRSSNYMVPFSSEGFGSGGAVIDAAISAAATACAAYVAAIHAANLYPVAWHRPAKGTFAGGQVGLIVGGVMPAMPSTLRSRRE